MPKRTVEIKVDELADGEALAALISYIAYPQPEKKRLPVQRMLYRYALKSRALRDKQWVDTIQPVRIFNLLEGPHGDATELKKCMKKFDAHMLMATHFLESNLESIANPNPYSRKLHKNKRGSGVDRVGLLPDGMKPTVENTALYVKRLLGGRGQDIATFKHDIWAPTKLICHLALAMSDTRTSWTTEPPYGRSLFYDLFFDEEFAHTVMRRSETIRLDMAKIPKLRLTEESTYQFHQFPPVPKRLRFA